MSPRVPIEFAPSGAVAWVDPGTTVQRASVLAGVPIAAPCGGRGVCGGCGVKVLAGELAPPDAAETAGLARAPRGVRLACRARVAGAVTVRPVVASNASRSSAAASTGPMVAGVDLGTTSVSAAAIDAATGREVGRATVPNRQVRRGADVLTRLEASLAGESDALKLEAEASVIEALELATAGATGRVERCVIAANPVMATLLAGASGKGLAAHPFAAPAGLAVAKKSALRGALAPGASLEVLPPVAAFVGGDALAGMLATGLADVERPTLLVDIGTNAEVVLATGETLVVASAPAGPAFEGGGIACGGPAVPGAVVRVVESDEGVVLETIGGAPATHLSGAGLVSAVAWLRRVGILDTDGLMQPLRHAPVSVHVGDDGVRAVRLGAGEGIEVTQLDVRAFQLAKAAVRAAIESVLAAEGVAVQSVDRLFIAGSFGAALSTDDLVELGVVPAATADVVVAVGNAALEGAIEVALDDRAAARIENLVGRARHVDLAADLRFSQVLMNAMSLARYGA